MITITMASSITLFLVLTIIVFTTMTVAYLIIERFYDALITSLVILTISVIDAIIFKNTLQIIPLSILFLFYITVPSKNN